jgi:hypothetical protein
LKLLNKKVPGTHGHLDEVRGGGACRRSVSGLHRTAAERPLTPRDLPSASHATPDYGTCLGVLSMSHVTRLAF